MKRFGGLMIKVNGGKGPRRQPEGLLKDEGTRYLRALPKTYVRHIQIGIIPGRKNRTKGVLDTVVIQRGRVVWIEWKTPGQKLSDEQAEFCFSWIACGGESYRVESMQELIKIFPVEKLRGSRDR